MLDFDPFQAFLLKCLGAAIIFGAIGISLKSNKGDLSKAFTASIGNIIAITVAALGLLVMGSQTDLGQKVLGTFGLA